jgi:hypothetical protein
VARKRRKKHRWLWTLVVFVMTPLTIWALAFLIWFYWYDITGFSSGQDKTPRAGASKEVGKAAKPSDKTFNERIGEEDRRKLDEILKSKN